MRTVLRLVLMGALAITCLAATASGAAAACPNESLRYGYGAYLPDCRAYEQATPVEKDGTNPQIAPGAVQAAIDGNGITFFSQAGVPGGTGASNLPAFLARRGATGWSTQGLLPPASLGQTVNTLGWTPDLGETVGYATQLGVGTALVAQSTSGGAAQVITPYTKVNIIGYRFAGASADDSKIFFEENSGVQLTPEAAAGKPNLYAWDSATETLGLVGVLPESECGSPPCVPPGGSRVAGNEYHLAENSVSTNGEKIYFEAGGELYLREDPTSASARTVHVSASQKTNGSGPGGTDPNGPQPAVFMRATPDGSQAFFTSASELTNDANTGSADQGKDLYDFNAELGKLTDLTPDPAAPNGAEVLGVVGASEDGSYVYFVANADLDGSGPATTGDCTGNDSGECNLYLWHEGKITFVARLDASGVLASVALGSNEKAVGSDETDWIRTGLAPGGLHVNNTGRVSTDGEVVVFRSHRKLTAYENEGMAEYYRYEAQTGRLACITCNPSGVPPTGGPPLLQRQTSFASNAALARLEARNLSSSGDQFFFETVEALLPADTNGVSDVYEWEADGAGSCNSSADGGGCLYLLSTGKSPDASNFGDASTSGGDVFIFTDQPLVGQDEDELIDVYDVRVNGGLPSQRAQALPACSSEGCKAPAGPPITVSAPSSQTFGGAGNMVPKTAKRRDCRAAAERALLLRRHAETLHGRIRALHRQIHRLSRRHRSPQKALHLRLKARRLRHRAGLLVKKSRAAAQATKRCRTASRGEGK